MKVPYSVGRCGPGNGPKSAGVISAIMPVAIGICAIGALLALRMLFQAQKTSRLTIDLYESD
jgi:hypothetical protein